MTQDPSTLYKLIVLYMLDKVKFKLTNAQISGFILEKEYTNYMTLQQVISDLLDTELIKADTSMNRTYYSITQEGQNTLSYFGNRISDAIQHDIDTFLAEKHLELKNEASITANYYLHTINTGYWLLFPVSLRHSLLQKKRTLSLSISGSLSLPKRWRKPCVTGGTIKMKKSTNI